MSGYIDLPIETDPQDIMDDFVTFMKSVAPDWEPAAGNLDVWLAQAMSLVAAESRDVASAIPRSIFRWFGANLVGIAPVDDVAASVMSTWVVKDNLGYTIPNGTQVSIAATGDQVYAFETVQDVVIPPGSTTASNVQLVALTPGSASSGLGSLGSTAALIDPLAFVTSITLAAATAGGADAETDDAYLNRLSTQLQLLAPRPIVAADFAAMALNVPGVARATALDGYDPTTGLSGNARMVAVAAVGSDGSPVSSAVKNAVSAYLQARREVNFVVNVIDPTVNLIDVTYNIHVVSGYDPSSVIAAVNAAITAYLDPASWGSGLNGSGWVNIPTLRYLELAQTINNVPGVDYITSTGGVNDLTFGLHGGALGRSDILMSGPAPLPDASTLTGTNS